MRILLIKIQGKDTYHYRKEIKEMGAYWNPINKYWYMIVSTYADPNRDQVKKVIRDLEEMLGI